MELLVLGSIVGLSLPIRLVFLSLWQPVQGAQASAPVGPAGQQGPPMRVTFRLQVTPQRGGRSSCCELRTLRVIAWWV